MTVHALLIALLQLALPGWVAEPVAGYENGPLPSTRIAVSTAAELDAVAAYSFVIMSDNKGTSHADAAAEPPNPHMSRAVAWTKDMHPRFVIGMGDHLKKGWSNTFVRFVASDPFWSSCFYPGIADGENEYYGTGQDDWAAGGRYLIDTGVAGRPNVVMRENGAEYYARIATPGGTVHLIQAHYPDQPANPLRAFRVDSRRWVCETLESIDRVPGDIVIVGAHSFTGNWLQVIAPGRRDEILRRADIVMSATTHHFERQPYGQATALCINTGSVGFSGDINGFVTVHVFNDPWRLVLQYVSTETTGRKLAGPGYAFVKEPGGPISDAVFGR